MEKGDKKGNAFLVYELLGISDVLVYFVCVHMDACLLSY